MFHVTGGKVLPRYYQGWRVEGVSNTDTGDHAYRGYAGLALHKMFRNMTTVPVLQGRKILAAIYRMFFSPTWLKVLTVRSAVITLPHPSLQQPRAQHQ